MRRKGTTVLRASRAGTASLPRTCPCTESRAKKSTFTAALSQIVLEERTFFHIVGLEISRGRLARVDYFKGGAPVCRCLLSILETLVELKRGNLDLFYTALAAVMGRASPFHEADGDYRTEKFMEGGSSALPLYSLQGSLPRLPVPTLEETFARYLESIRPLADQEGYETSAAAARDFLRPGGLVSTFHVSHLQSCVSIVHDRSKEPLCGSCSG